MILNHALSATKDIITGLGWVERYGGVSFPVVKDMGGEDVGGEYRPIYKRFPISEGMSVADCWQGNGYQNLCPDSRYQNLLYWEVLSDATYRNHPHTPPKGTTFEGRVRLVYWLNLAKMGIAKADSHQSALIGLGLAGELIGKTYHPEVGVKLILSEPSLELKDSKRVFPYDYDFAHEAMMVYPYGFGAVQFKATIHATPNCVPDLVTGTAIQCVTEW